MMNALRMLGFGALALGFSLLPARADDAVKDIPGPIDSLQDLQDTGKMLFKLADANNDGLISQKEATDAGNLFVGGFFFRADANGDGVVSKAEMQQARDEALAQRPLLRMIVTKTKRDDPKTDAKARDASQNALSVIDSNGDGQVQASETRQMVQTGVQSLFAAADTNRDGKMSPTEVNAAIAGAAKTVVQAAFQEADTDTNGQLSQAEYDKAIIQPANAIFHMLDANNDGQVSTQEFMTAERILASQLRQLYVPEPANSAKHLIQSGRTPSEVAPVPNIAPASNRAPQPAR
jgi:Ca2+-binding EF-hand superfamily protein